MPGFGDSAVLVLLALLLFGPKKLPVLARQLGKLMGDFRRASNEFRSQMEEELRLSEQADRQKEIAALEAAAPKPAIVSPAETEPSTSHESSLDQPLESLPAGDFATTPEPESKSPSDSAAFEPAPSEPAPPPLPIATSGELSIMPPSTGLPVANTSLAPFLDSIPAAPSSATANHTHNGTNGISSALAGQSESAPASAPENQHEASTPEDKHETEARPWMI